MWRKSNAHADAAGVEVAVIEGVVTVRDAKDPYSAVLIFSRAEWLAFTAGVRAGEFDYPAPREVGDDSGVDGPTRVPGQPLPAS